MPIKEFDRTMDLNIKMSTQQINGVLVGRDIFVYIYSISFTFCSGMFGLVFICYKYLNKELKKEVPD